MLFTPGLAFVGGRLATVIERRPSARADGPETADAESLDHHVLVAGYGRVGQTIARLLVEQSVAHLAIDRDAEVARRARARGEAAVYGDATRKDVLERLGAARAAALIVTLDDPVAARQVVAVARDAWPGLKLFARARDAEHAAELEKLGATEVVPETLESSLSLARGALAAIGVPGAAGERLGGRD
jgi:CPA2 family monovalent cation:H+ antiporter-2